VADQRGNRSEDSGVCVRPNVCALEWVSNSSSLTIKSDRRKQRVKVYGAKLLGSHTRLGVPPPVIFRDGLISFQVTVCTPVCPTCISRVAFVLEQLAQQDIQHFWTYESDLWYITFHPPTKTISGKKFLSRVLRLTMETSPRINAMRAHRMRRRLH
jgi:hypothetical protein